MLNVRLFSMLGVALAVFWGPWLEAAEPGGSVTNAAARRPNILVVISDDQSWPHAGAYGCRFVNTPAFDRVAAEGVLFTNAFTAAPQCSPNRAAILAGRPIGGLREAGTHCSLFPRDLAVYPQLLAEAGYLVGADGKGWAPGEFTAAGWPHNPAGPGARGFEAFLARRRAGQPFCFWYGSTHPHRGYKAGSGIAAGKDPAAVTVPSYLPDTPAVRSDFLDYALAIEQFDGQLNRLLTTLRAAGELDTTLVVVTSDNGMPFPRAKATLYDDGLHVPLAIRWPAHVRPGRTTTALVSHVDLAPTFLEAAGIAIPASMVGRSLLPLLTEGRQGGPEVAREFILAGRERHTSARPDNAGYPSRAIRTDRHLLIVNYRPERHPLGDHGDDVDDGPTKRLVMKGRNDPALRRWHDLCFGLRPREELYDIQADPGCIDNRADDPACAAIRADLLRHLTADLVAAGDPRELDGGDIFDSYPRFAPIRPIAGPGVVSGRYVEKFLQPDQSIPAAFAPPGTTVRP